jgi:hypothetical protein
VNVVSATAHYSGCGSAADVSDTVHIYYNNYAVSISNTVTDESCSGCMDGSVTINASGGSGSYTYSISPSAGLLTGQTYNSLPAGNYLVCATDTNGCSACDSVTVGVVTSVEEMKAGSFSIHPNPTNNNFTVSFNQLKVESGKLKMLDVTGRVVLVETLRSQHSTFNFQLNPGIYFVQITVGEKMWTQKLVVE